MIIVLSKEQIDFLFNCTHQHCPETWSPRYQEFKKSVIQALSHPLDQEIVEKLEERKQRELDIPLDHSDAVASGIGIAQEIVKSYGE